MFMVSPVHPLYMSQTLTEPGWTHSTDTQTHDLGTVLRGTALFVGLTMGLVLLVGYPLVVVIGGGIGLTLRRVLGRFGPRIRTAVPEEGLTHRIRLPFTDVRLVTTIEKDL